jgi:integrase
VARIAKFPVVIRNQGVSVKIYRVKAKSSRSGFTHKVQWVGADGADHQTFTQFSKARDFAQGRAAQLAAGVASGLQMTQADWIELTEIRELSAQVGVSPLAAMQEWRRGHDLVGSAIIEACAAHAARQTSTLERITVREAIVRFIKAKDEAGKEGSRVYGAKLKPVGEQLGDLFLDMVSVRDWSRFLSRFDDPVTRNDIRKRIVTLCRWARSHGHLADQIRTEIEKTERAKERANPIGILTPEEYRKLLHFFREKHPHHLAALVIAGFCGVRSDELHGKRGDPSRRQLWSDVHLDRGFLSVTAAKENTPSNRVVHFQPVATAWLRQCRNREGPVCQNHAMDRIRDIAATNGMPIPPNALRHSFITYLIALTGDKAATATEAGNSVKEIDRRYRVPRPKADGEAWFAIMP